MKSKCPTQADQSTSLNFYFHENIQLKIKLILKDGAQSVYMMFENIVDKVAHGELNSKLSYSILLLNSLSHEMLTPLHHLLGISGILLKQASLNKNREEVNSNSQDRAAIEGIRMVNQIALGMNITAKNTLDFANILNNTFEYKKKKFKVKDLLEYLLSVFSMRSKKKKLIMKCKCDERLEIISDYNRLAGLIFNFIDNSVKFTQQGGVTLTAKLIRGSEGRPTVEFKIVDTGVGICENDLEKISLIFKDPFLAVKTTDSAGLGIGLRISQELLKRLSGGDLSIEISSEKGVGTTIRFEIQQGMDDTYGTTSKVDGHMVSYMNVSCRSEIMINENEMGDEDRAREFCRERETLKPVKSMPSKSSNLLSVENVEEHNNFYESESPYARGGDRKESLVEDGVSGFKKYSKRRIISVSIKQKDTLDDFMEDIEDLGHHNTRQDSLQQKKPISRSSLWFDVEIASSRFGTVYKPKNELADRSQYAKKIALVVDDDMMNSEIATMIISSFGVEVHSALNGDLAIDLCCKFLIMNKRIDIIFMDYNMPGMCGDEVTKILKEERFDQILKDTFIVGLTAQTDSETKQKCIESGMNRVECKPFDATKFKELFREYKLIE